MSSNELLEKVKALPLRERRKFFQGIHELEEKLVIFRQRRWHPAAP
jgi:hypothetical protein